MAVKGLVGIWDLELLTSAHLIFLLLMVIEVKMSTRNQGLWRTESWFVNIVWVLFVWRCCRNEGFAVRCCHYCKMWLIKVYGIMRAGKRAADVRR
jgi:hypothetical protein